MILFEIVDKLFIKFEKVYGDFFHCKKYVIEIFKELKMGMRLFNTFYSKFIKLAIKLEFKKEILLQEFTYKPSPQMQDLINSGLEYLDNIKDLATMHY